MQNLPTSHINALYGEVAETVLMPGDPLRAKYIAEFFLTDVKCFNKVRGMLGFTGNYNGRRVSVMGSGMGMPSIGIYSHELYNFYGVNNIIRLGSAGSISNKLKLRDILLAIGACTNSNLQVNFNIPGTLSLTASYNLLKSAESCAKNIGITINIGSVISSDVFYEDEIKSSERWSKFGVLAVEMEAAILYFNAMKYGKNALCMLTISDDLIKNESITTKERQVGFENMAKLALETAITV